MESPLVLERAPGVPLYLSLADALRDAIHAGRFRPSERLPATRVLAISLGLSRNTVVDAYDHLRAEGYIAGRPGASTIVAADLPVDRLEVPSTVATATASQEPRPLSAFANRVLALDQSWPSRHPGPVDVDFRYGTPEFDDFPLDTWRALTRRVLDYPAADLLGYGEPEGLPALREAIATYLRRARGVACTAADVIVVNGSQQALDLAARCLLDLGDAVAIEDPCYLGALSTFRAAGATLTHVPCDDHGIVVDRLPASARLVYVTPSHQFPSGAVLCAPRRMELLAWAARAGAFVFEDDYCSEFRYDGRPLAALQGLDTNQTVIYAGTLSKLLLPGLRLGYMVVPPSVAPAVRAAKLLADRHAPLFTQAILAAFMSEGHFDRHLRRMRRVYRARRDALIEAVAANFGDRATVGGVASGMHLLITLEGIADSAAFAARAAALGVRVYDAGPYYHGERPGGAVFLLGYSSVPAERIRDGVRRLALAAGHAS